MAKRYVAPKHSVGKMVTTKTAFGSTSDMVVSCEDVSIQHLQINSDEVICKDDHGLYITNLNRINSGLADPNRYANVSARTRCKNTLDSSTSEG